ncbi:hypothetical protein B484DRAFT_408465 [Ochromonadaceae sp. CCMP2298]|nr:hypothetical protein B484DRAFT_408465 [Ochromonadaceae sp. CCMP2298]
MSGTKISPKDGKVATINMLESTSVLPHAFASWSNDTQLLFKYKNLFVFLQSSAASVFAEAEPLFGCWELEGEEEIPEEPTTGAKKDLTREFLQAAQDQSSQNQNATPFTETGGSIAEALSRMLADIDAETERRSGGEGKMPEDGGGTRMRRTAESPDAETFRKAGKMRVAPSVDFYYRRLDAHSKIVETQEKRLLLHDAKVDAAMNLLRSTLSYSVQLTFRNELASRNLYLIWDKIAKKCRPRKGTEGLGELDKERTNMNSCSSAP